MLKHKNKLAVLCLVLAVLSFACFTVGGEFLHSQIHHHPDQDSHDQCFIYQLQIQIFTVISTVVIAFLIKCNGCISATSPVIIVKFYRGLTNPRAPPTLIS